MGFGMKRSLKSAVVAPLLAVCLLASSTVSGAVSYPQKKTVLALIDQKMRIDGIPGVSFAVVQDGRISWSGALGLANIENAITANPDTVYRSASLVKPVTATAILQLQQAGKLDLDAPVWNYCTDFPAKPHTVTTRQLLTHTAGVRSYAMPWSVYEAELFSTRRYESVSAALSIFADDPLLHEPGSSYKYTSYGYNVLGCVIEGISGVSYSEYINRHIMKPAGMKNTRVARSETIVTGRAGVYRRNSKGALVNEKYVDLTNKIPSGGLLTTATDMARFTIAYMTGDLLENEAARTTYQPIELTDGSRSYYGMGWDMNKVAPENRGREMYHVGVTPGVTGIMYLFPETTSSIVLFGNLFNVSDTEQWAQAIENVIDLKKPSSGRLLSNNSD